MAITSRTASEHSEPRTAIGPAAIRRPSVAGYYYPANRDELAHAVEALSSVRTRLTSALAVVVPHGSYRHAGAILGSTLGRVRIPRRCILLGPSHVGTWKPWSMLARGAYRTPLGDVPIDEVLAEALCLRCPFLAEDPGAQRGEHAIEVILPFLQRLGPADLQIVPVVIGAPPLEELAHVAEALAHVVRMCEEPVLLIASADLSHYESRDEATRRDAGLIQAMAGLNGAAFLRDVHDHGVVMCTALVVAPLLDAARALGATETVLAQYGTSAEAGGDPHSVIGYAGIIMS